MRYKYIIYVFAFVLYSCTSNNQEKQPGNSDQSTDKMYGDEITLTTRFKAFDTTVTVLFWDTTDSINEVQMKNFHEFISKQDSLFPDILNAIFEDYKKSYSAYKDGWRKAGYISTVELEKHLPTPTTPNNLKAFITPGVIHVQNKKECKEGTLGIEFDCTWDIENGLGIMIENWKVVKTGVAEASYF
jgi:hypothetical protein